MKSVNSVPASCRTTIPVFLQTEIVEPDEVGAERRVLTVDAVEHEYYVRPTSYEIDGRRTDNKPSWFGGAHKRFPIVLNADSSLWEPACLYLAEGIDNLVDSRKKERFISKADDIAHFKKFLDEEEVSWTEFPKLKQKRPTYRYRAHLLDCVEAGEVAASTASRRLSSVVAFYRYCIEKGMVAPEYPAWQEKVTNIPYSDEIGRARMKQVYSTDLRIYKGDAPNPFDDRVLDGERLTPLTPKEQEALVEALAKLGNTEMTLSHKFALACGARIQSVFTLRLKHFSTEPEAFTEEFVRIAAGPGTEIDTKNNKRGMLIVPKSLYTEIYVYIKSPRYKNRCLKSRFGMHPSQYVFLTNKGAPFYVGRGDLNSGAHGEGMASAKAGQAVRKCISERLRPMVRQLTKNDKFNYKFHDLRASFGENVLRYFQPAVDEGTVSMSQVIDFLAVIMWHSSTEVTKRYVNRYLKINEVRQVNDKYYLYLQGLINKYKG